MISSSIGTILKSCGVRVTAIKIDPYLNIDAGTFSPYEHGKFAFVFGSGCYCVMVQTLAGSAGIIYRASTSVIFGLRISVHLASQIYPMDNHENSNKKLIFFSLANFHFKTIPSFFEMQSTKKRHCGSLYTTSLPIHVFSVS